MAVSPQGISIQAAYRWYREGRLLVNRQYQRKLVWAISEKERLIDSILRDYPAKEWELRANLAAGEAQAIWYHLLVRTCSDDVAARHSDAWKAWNRARKG